MPTILVVDDEVDLLKIIVDQLNFEGMFAIGSKCAEDAIQILSDRKIDLILSDVRMPDINGMEFFERAKEMLHPLPPFLLMTGFPDPSINATVEQGIRQVIPKPFKLQELVKIIREALIKSNS